MTKPSNYVKNNLSEFLYLGVTFLENKAMKTALKFILLMVVFAGVSSSNAGFARESRAITDRSLDMTAEELIADLYEQHDDGEGPFFQTEDRARLDKYFVRSIADVIWKDAEEAEGEAGALDFDPLYNAQDIEITDLAIGKAVAMGNKSKVTVTFKNFDEAREINFELMKEKGVWKIADINYGEFTLSSVFENNDDDA